MALFAVLVTFMVAGTVSAVVNTTGITNMSDTIVALLIALIPILLILGIWAKMKGVFSIVPLAIFAVNTTGITDMADTIIVLLIALLPIILILGIWGKMKGVF